RCCPPPFPSRASAPLNPSTVAPLTASRGKREVSPPTAACGGARGTPSPAPGDDAQPSSASAPLMCSSKCHAGEPASGLCRIHARVALAQLLTTAVSTGAFARMINRLIFAIGLPWRPMLISAPSWLVEPQLTVRHEI
uniref:Uncharacterized protein n=1 Tax=Aegilops tauschii subsp. strangulata TaxID=200361 RepID=A0A453CZB0_AEGTS